MTIDRATCALPPVFVVFATQNPIEHQGTYPLPEAQKDRFLVKIRMDYPAAEEENELARLVAEGETPERDSRKNCARRFCNRRNSNNCGQRQSVCASARQ